MRTIIVALSIVLIAGCSPLVYYPAGTYTVYQPVSNQQPAAPQVDGGPKLPQSQPVVVQQPTVVYTYSSPVYWYPAPVYYPCCYGSGLVFHYHNGRRR